jgi:Ca2+-binding RTX toxin-like protein
MQKAISVLAVGTLLVMLFGGAASAGAGGLIGTPGDDKMVGTDAAAGDTMAALGGRDTVDARGGRDLVFGGPGDDGGMDGPALYGDSPDHETDSSLDGDDAVRGGPGYDALHGFGGDDLLAGGTGNDRVFAGEDRFDPRGPMVPTENPGEDAVRGGPGNDFVFAADGHADEIDCGGGARDSAHFDRGLDIVRGCEIQNRGT